MYVRTCTFTGTYIHFYNNMIFSDSYRSYTVFCWCSWCRQDQYWPLVGSFIGIHTYVRTVMHIVHAIHYKHTHTHTRNISVLYYDRTRKKGLIWLKKKVNVYLHCLQFVATSYSIGCLILATGSVHFLLLRLLKFSHVVFS